MRYKPDVLGNEATVDPRYWSYAPRLLLGDTYTFGSDRPYAIEVVDTDTGEAVTLTPAGEHSHETDEIALRFHDGDGTLFPPERRQVWTTDDPPEMVVDVTGETALFETGSVFGAYVVRLLEDGAEVDATAPRVFATGYPGEFQSTGSTEALEIRFDRHSEVPDAWTAQLRIARARNYTVYRETAMDVSADGTEFLTTLDVSDIDSDEAGVWLILYPSESVPDDDTPAYPALFVSTSLDRVLSGR